MNILTSTDVLYNQTFKLSNRPVFVSFDLCSLVWGKELVLWPILCIWLAKLQKCPWEPKPSTLSKVRTRRRSASRRMRAGDFRRELGGRLGTRREQPRRARPFPCLVHQIIRNRSESSLTDQSLSSPGSSPGKDYRTSMRLPDPASDDDDDWDDWDETSTGSRMKILGEGVGANGHSQSQYSPTQRPLPAQAVYGAPGQHVQQ